AINTAPALFKKFNIESEIWFPGESFNNPFHSITPIHLKTSKLSYLKELIIERNLKPENDIIVTHSAWSFQSGWGNFLAQNGFKPAKKVEWETKKKKKIFLFMARLHHKKGVLPLVKAWLHSPLQNNANYELVIAGPDEDELKKIKPLLAQSDNAIYVGPIYN